MDELMDGAPCGFVAFGDDGTILEVNRTLLDLLGYPRVELEGWHIDKVLPPGGRIFYHTYLFPMLKVQQHVEEMYLALRTKDGRDVPVLFNGVRRERGGRTVCDCICVRMIQRHEYEAQLLQARRIAEKASEARAKFLSMMSHDLRTPLTAIYGNAQLLAADEGTLTEEQMEAVRAIQDGARMQMALIGDILEFARLDSGNLPVKPQAVPVAEAIARARTLVRTQANDAGLELQVNDTAADLSVLADPDRLQQILLNLLTNAIKFTPPGGRIAIECGREDDRVRIRVRDTGIGIAGDHLQSIFAPFVQVEGAPIAHPVAIRGVGLGLAISRELARAMNGDVTAESTPGAGSIFTVDLPAATADVGERRAAVVEVC
jgi:PAS domain S-box-containing protein